MYGTDTCWPASPEMYREPCLQPQLGLFETATILGHIAGEGGPAREEYRNMIFLPERLRALAERHKGAPGPQALPRAIETPNAHHGHSHG